MHHYKTRVEIDFFLQVVYSHAPFHFYHWNLEISVIDPILMKIDRKKNIYTQNKEYTGVGQQNSNAFKLEKNLI